METTNIGAITGAGNRVGDYRKPVKNSYPNPEDWWWTSVLFTNGWRQFQEKGEEAIYERLDLEIYRALGLEARQRLQMERANAL